LERWLIGLAEFIEEGLVEERLRVAVCGSSLGAFSSWSVIEGWRMSTVDVTVGLFHAVVEYSIEVLWHLQNPRHVPI
jgi:hypothetical protein